MLNVQLEGRLEDFTSPNPCLLHNESPQTCTSNFASTVRAGGRLLLEGIGSRVSPLCWIYSLPQPPHPCSSPCLPRFTTSHLPHHLTFLSGQLALWRYHCHGRSLILGHAAGFCIDYLSFFLKYFLVKLQCSNAAHLIEPVLHVS